MKLSIELVLMLFFLYFFKYFSLFIGGLRYAYSIDQLQGISMTTTKITMKIRDDILDAFNRRLDSCFLKRDAFLNHMIKSETPHLEREMQGLRLSTAARRYTSHQLMSMDKTTINVVVEKQTADELKRVLKDANIVRDAFANRLMLMLISTDSLLKRLELPTETTAPSLRNAEPMPTSPLASIFSALGDPFFYFRTCLEESGESLYRLDLPAPFQALVCCLDDAYVPGTKAYQQRVSEEGTPLEIFV
jgi:hypothetical protein